jgi:hypothetical protein
MYSLFTCELSLCLTHVILFILVIVMRYFTCYKIYHMKIKVMQVLNHLMLELFGGHPGAITMH